MGQSNLERKIIKAMDNNPIGSLATVEGKLPRNRYMMLFHDGLTVYMATDKKTHKVEELEENPNVHLLFGMEKEIVSLEGTCTISDDKDLRHKLWNKEFENWYSGPDDPDYVVLVVEPSRIEYSLNSEENTEMEVWEAEKSKQLQ
ncbi:general stress protein [Paenibacillus swuensis]|uniref:General stress protein n=1 Tax=Paenibacillus swuensis TaxID=1178515 RepID=A0A172TDT3_9BACL|nr:pyridoxamine 5'-phosphate oxidase family protein [Paenibacillus swuensis]ANE45198.1 general stress protein [Paenibacillus swuensis]